MQGTTVPGTFTNTVTSYFVRVFDSSLALENDIDGNRRKFNLTVEQKRSEATQTKTNRVCSNAGAGLLEKKFCFELFYL